MMGLRERTFAAVDDAIEMSKRKEYSRAMQGQTGESQVTFCLGYGRCLIDPEKAQSIVCPFCITYPISRDIDVRKQSIVDALVSGN